jgi:hypothetical protein
MKQFIKNHKGILITFTLGLALGTHVGYVTNSLLHKTDSGNGAPFLSAGQNPLKIIHEINTVDTREKFISQREFVARFPKAYKALSTISHSDGHETHKLDGTLYLTRKGEPVVYYYNGHEQAYMLLYSHASNTWYETEDK